LPLEEVGTTPDSQRIPEPPRAPASGRCCLAGGLHGSRCLLDQRLKGVRVTHGKVSENLAIDRDACLVQAVDELAISRAALAGSGVDTLDPKRAEIALAALTVAISVLLRPPERLLGDPDRILSPAVIAFGSLENFLVLRVAYGAAFDTHCRAPSDEGVGMGIASMFDQRITGRTACTS